MQITEPSEYVRPNGTRDTGECQGIKGATSYAVSPHTDEPNTGSLVVLYQDASTPPALGAAIRPGCIEAHDPQRMA